MLSTTSFCTFSLMHLYYLICLLYIQFEDIGPHGTKVIIYNLWLNDEGIFELNFDDDDEVCCPLDCDTWNIM